MKMLVFPGQGSQQPGMGKYLYDNFGEAKQTFEEASDALGINMAKLCFDGTEEELTKTENTQPALLTTSTATARVLANQFGINAIAGAGHSIGEYAALVAAGSIGFSPSVKAVRIRGQAMQSAVPAGEGGMAAVMGLEPKQVEELCAATVQNYPQAGVLSPANFNAPGQIVISGNAKALEAAKSLDPVQIWGESAPKRMRLIPLQVSAPFHCALMKPAEEKMRDVLFEIKFDIARFPIIQNWTAQVEQRPNELRENLIRQVSGSVKWMQSMNLAAAQGWLNVIEVGHGKVLQGLLKKIDPRFQVQGTSTLEELKAIEKENA